MDFSLSPEASHPHFTLATPGLLFQREPPTRHPPAPTMANFPCSASPVWSAWRGILPGRRVSWKLTESVPLLSPNESWYWPQPCWAALWRAVGTAWEFDQQTAEETEPQDSHHGRHQQPLLIFVFAGGRDCGEMCCPSFGAP